MTEQTLPQRKQTRLSNYDYSQQGTYYVTICTQGRKPVLSRIVGEEAGIVLLPSGLVVEKYIKNAHEVTKYVIMPDHIHMIVELDSGEKWETTVHQRKRNRIASIVRSIKTLTTKEIGISLFQRGYYEHVIRNQQDYDETWEYIDNNPRKWVLQKREYE